MFEVLLFLLEHYDDAAHCPSEWQLVRSLALADFETEDVARTLLWLGQLSALEKKTTVFAVPSEGSIRCWTDSERTMLDANCLGALLELEREGVLDAADREAAIAGVALLAGGALNRSQWMLLMLFALWRRNRTPGREKMRELLRVCRQGRPSVEDDSLPMLPLLP